VELGVLEGALGVLDDALGVLSDALGVLADVLSAFLSSLPQLARARLTNKAANTIDIVFCMIETPVTTD